MLLDGVIEINNALAIRTAQRPQVRHFEPVIAIFADRNTVKISACHKRRGRWPVGFITEFLSPEGKRHVGVSLYVDAKRRLVSRVCT